MHSLHLNSVQLYDTTWDADVSSGDNLIKFKQITTSQQQRPSGQQKHIHEAQGTNCCQLGMYIHVWYCSTGHKALERITSASDMHNQFAHA